MQIDRSIAPTINRIEEVQFEQAEKLHLDNGVELFVFKAMDMQVVRFDWIFEAGAVYHDNFKLPLIVNKLLTEGSSCKSADELATIIDFCGANIRTEVGKEKGYISLSVLPKHLKTMMALMAEIIQEATFPENEMQLFIGRKAQELQINQQKVSFLARDRFPSLLFGENHVYGRPTLIDDFVSVTPEQIRDFHKNQYQSKKPKILAAGYVGDEEIKCLNQFFGQDAYFEVERTEIQHFNSSAVKKQQLPVEGSVQNAIRLGKLWPNRLHKDYVGLQILVTLFGGYFGSRLMTNIREDKGYTYGIGAGVKHFKNASFFFIGSEVKAENYQDVIREIHVEMDDLKQNIVSLEELNQVKTVIQGSFQRGFDGAFAKADRFKELLINDLNNDYYENFIKQLNHIHPEQLLKLANQYFDQNTLFELIVGNFN